MIRCFMRTGGEHDVQGTEGELSTTKTGLQERKLKKLSYHHDVSVQQDVATLKLEYALAA